MLKTTRSKGTDSHNHSKTYVLTCDLAQKVQSMQNLGLKTPEPNDPFFDEVKNGLVGYIERALPEVDVYAISMPKLVADILSTAQDLRRTLLQDSCIVSTCNEITSPMHGFTLDINRLVNSDGDLIGLGPRPGYASIDSQISGIVAATQGKSIVIVEDGSFTGSTIVHVLERFKAHHQNIAGIVLGLIFPAAEKKIRQHFTGELIMTEPISKGILDWMPDHDFFPWIPNSGRVIGHQLGQLFYPVYTFNGFAFSIPYILTYAPMDKWASIVNKQVACQMSLYCVHKTIELFEMMEGLNNKPITTKDFKAKKPVVCVPFACGQSRPPKYNDVRIIDSLNETAHDLA